MNYKNEATEIIEEYSRAYRLDEYIAARKKEN